MQQSLLLMLTRIAIKTLSHVSQFNVQNNYTVCSYVANLSYFLDDHSRVVLKLEDNCPGSDYINASFIDVSNNPEIHGCGH